VVVICGGIGHSTPFLYDAIARHPRYNSLASEVQGYAEARVLQIIAERWFGLTVSEPTQTPEVGGLTIIVEDVSTNCGANAYESRRVLEACGILSPRSIIVAQDPTMCRRTVASFEKTYRDHQVNAPKIIGWPTFVPKVDVTEGNSDHSKLQRLDFSDSGPTGILKPGLWEMHRFVDLLVGEIP
jgi:uncharacterized SAM-binding protein YcdF (DUF218 family)